jgi:amidase
MESAVQLARAVAAGERTAREVVDAHLARVEARNPPLNALTRVVDSALGAGPLAGVPFSVKENIDVAGTPTTFGLRGDVPDAAFDAPHIAHLRAAGAVPIARGNLPDLALRWHTESARHGTTVNPWDASLSPGGSSGGDAVAVATGMVAFAVGSDYGGSLRVPASLARVFALRPTPGRLAQVSAVPPSMSRQLFATDGLLARTVEDLALLVPIMAKPDPRDPRYTPAGWGPGMTGPIDVAIALADAAVLATAGALEGAGHHVTEVELPHLARLAELWRDLLAFDSGPAALPRLREFGCPGTLSFVESLLTIATPLDGAGYAQALAERHAAAAEWSGLLARHPIILGPVSAEPPWRVGHDLAGPEAVHDEWWGFRLTVATSALGLPALSLPTGTQLIATRWNEALLLDVASQIT